jgi:hypothetical protein
MVEVRIPAEGPEACGPDLGPGALLGIRTSFAMLRTFGKAFHDEPTEGILTY